MRLRKWLFGVLVLGVLAFSGYTWITLNYVYAQGERAGYIQKFSRKGWMFKTWEGELAMVNLPGAMPEIFHFSVRLDPVVKEIESSLGRRVVIHYNQHRGIPVKIFGETAYYVTSVREVTSETIPAEAPSTPPTDPKNTL